MKLYIKNMVCNRCNMVVEQELKAFGLNVKHVELGEAEVAEELSKNQQQEIDERLQKLGFQLMDDKKSRLIEKIKTCILEIIYKRKEPLKTNLSVFISEKLNQDYSYLSNLFSSVQGVTIEHFFISQKIERVKELLIYDELSLSEIADQLHYSSVSHLSKQFKKVTGLTPTEFKQLQQKIRTPLDEL